MIVLVRGFGNHTNRLIQNAHLEAFCAAEGIPYTNTTFLKMAHHYPLKYNYASALYYKTLFRTRLSKFWVPFILFDDEAKVDEYKDLLRAHKKSLLFVGGWHFRAYETLQQYRTTLIKKYESQKRSPRFDTIVQKLTSHDLVLGLHIRRQDYKHWRGGKYFYPLELYKHFAEKFFTLFRAQSPLVIVFTDDPSIAPHFHLDVPFLFSQLPYYLDHKLMGQCHYLIGPPSTFTLWPSFLYQVPYTHIEDPTKELTREDFKVSRG